MTDSNYSVNADEEYLDYLDEGAEQIADEYRREIIAEEAANQQQVQEAQQAQDVQYDPRNADTWGAKALIKEGQSILSGGLQDTASSIATFPERTIDALSGEMQREREETGTYKPEFTPFGGYDNPIETKTWWGKQLRGLVHFGSLAVGSVLTAKAAAATGVVPYQLVY